MAVPYSTFDCAFAGGATIVAKGKIYSTLRKRHDPMQQKQNGGNFLRSPANTLYRRQTGRMGVVNCSVGLFATLTWKTPTSLSMTAINFQQLRFRCDVL